MAERPVHKHGRTEFFIEDEGVIAPTAMPSPRLKLMVPGVEKALEAAEPKADTKRAFRFCRMFPNLAQFRPDDAGLIALGKSLDDPFVAGQGDTTIPAGFTYFGQFVDHDITFDKTDGLPDGALKPEEIEQGRSPTLELDSLYGRGPTNSPELYEADKLRFKLGTTTGRPIFGVTQTFPNDLPRNPPGDNVKVSKKAIIGDPRNDENLIVAQTHLAFLKFHNKVVDKLQADGTPPAKLFEEARKTVIQHYQSIVLHDFVARLVSPAAFDAVIAKNTRKAFSPKGPTKGKHLCMPLEFSVAAYRLGHSLIRNRYQWNRVFSTGGPAGPQPLSQFFEFSKNADKTDLGGQPTVPSDWIVDWRRMYDFSELPGGTRHPQMNFTRQIDSNLATNLQDLPEFRDVPEEHLRFLAVRNLLRGRLVGLPTGQDVAKELGVTVLTPAEAASGRNSATVLAQGFETKTPLWYYILIEAEVQQAGLKMGEVGGRLVAETFHGLVSTSEYSILKQAGWKPTLPSVKPDHYSMTDLLTFVNDINPLGDGP